MADARLDKLKGEIRELPTIEKIRLAADGLAAGWDVAMVASVLRLAATELEAARRAVQGARRG